MFDAIDHVGVRVTDIARAVAFYERLGFTHAYRDDRGSTLIAGNAKLFLFTSRDGPAPEAEHSPGSLRTPPGIDHITLVVPDVDRVHTELRARGVTFVGEPADRDWGARLVGLDDPDGNSLYLLQWIN